MPSYLLECDIPDADTLDTGTFQAVAGKTRALIRQRHPAIRWVQGVMTRRTIICLCIAPSAWVVRDHARRAGLAVDRVREVATLMAPTVVRHRGADGS